MTPFHEILREIEQEITSYRNQGQVAGYIPELARVDPNRFGIHIECLDGKHFALGESEVRFSIQSISKVFAVALAMARQGERIWTRVGVEPSGNPFNSLVQLEYEKGIPRNPLINAGALVICDILLSILDDPMGDFLAWVRKLAGDDTIAYNEAVARSEREHGFRNAGLVHFMKSFGNIENPPEAVLDLYFHQCAIEMSCRELAQAFLLFANHGILPATGEQILSSSLTKRLNAIMLTCGFYDEAGEFAYKVGLPGKSGVGGGIAAIHPQHYSVAVWSPRLNMKGNSVLGMKALEFLTTKTGSSIF